MFNWAQRAWILTYGYSLAIYAYKSLRVAVDRKTGEIAHSYVFKRRYQEHGL